MGYAFCTSIVFKRSFTNEGFPIESVNNEKKEIFMNEA